jgi:hypothetical protein
MRADSTASFFRKRLTVRDSILQIAVLDPTLRSRELARRAIGRLGHVPVTFASVDELQERAEEVNNFGTLLLACPRDPARGVRHPLRPR